MTEGLLQPFTVQLHEKHLLHVYEPKKIVTHMSYEPKIDIYVTFRKLN